MSHWLMKVGELLSPLHEALRNHVTTYSGYIGADESPIQVRDLEKKGKTHRGFMWVYYDYGDKLVVFDYQKTRGHHHAHRILENFQGLLQTDGYGAYDIYDKKEKVIPLGCMAHARRYFFDAKQNDPQRSRFFLDRVAVLYQIERELAEQGATHEAILKRRQQDALPILEELKTWLIEQALDKTVLPKSSIGKAISYSLKRWHKLSEYAYHGMARIDNNLVENKIRPLALGRKNFLFAGSHKAAAHAAMFYSLIASAELNGLNPYHYLYTVLLKIPTHPVNQLEKLLPYNFEPAELDTSPPAKLVITDGQ